MRELVLLGGLVFLTLAFFSYGHPFLRRLGLVVLTATLFAAGFFATGRVWAGVLCACGWLALPWIEILFRVRGFRLPMHKRLRPSRPPREAFPELEELSAEIEESGFERADDLGWEMDGYRQFLRLFVCPARREEAAITFVEQSGLGFHFLSVTSRTADGSVLTTWNCPVSSSLAVPPHVRVNRIAGTARFPELLARHGDFLADVPRREFGTPATDVVGGAVERDMEVQMRHNLDEGILRPAGEGFGRYSWRGMLFLWFQFLRDIFRLT